ncbi:serine hydrolase [Enhygromyxa salina]|uniref:serine hydrolase n=1 Tax=Enhygromyxa salina TaxID=215803 RepID=UPI0015E64895|nr:serine hydrolase [Enhygromyxa salina]
MIALLLTACPEDDVGATGGGETAGTTGPGEPDPVDPLDGEGSNPPEKPDASSTWNAPTTLGNGMVHDSRYDLRAGEYSRKVNTLELAAGVDWSFVGSHRQKLQNGFRPTSVDAHVSLTDNGELVIIDRSVYMSDDDANFRTETKTYVFVSVSKEMNLSRSGPSSHGEPRPTSIDTFSLPDGRFGDTIVWTYDNSSTPWRLIVGQVATTFNATRNALEDAGFRPISIASRSRGGVSRYSAIFVQDDVSASDWTVSLGQTEATLADTITTQWGNGYYPFRLTSESGAQEPVFNILWTKRTPELKLEIRQNLDEALFNEQDTGWRQQGYHLENACAYQDAGVERYTGLWTRSEPYLRMTVGDTLDENSPTFAARYAPLEDQIIQVMTLAGSAKEGNFFRPSGTLHVFEGDELVLNRAYTYAPANYPDTELNAPMALASVSKSITAAAVVRELNLRGVPLTAPFAGTAGITGVPKMVMVPTVVDVLRNLGGFNEQVASYNDHSLMGMDYPIDGQKMYDYVTHPTTGHLGVGGTDSYWDLMTYQESLNLGKFYYSNPGFSMLGELVRIQSGVPYANYVRDNLLAPLNLHQEIYPDPGHRNAVSEPTQAGLRSYLINSAHPYTCDPQTCTPATPRSASEPVPVPSAGDLSPRWGENAGPIDSSAPAHSALTRYAGRVYMGGAPLAAGGWHADGESLGVFIRSLAQFGYLMPQTTARQLWDPQWWNMTQNRAPGWAYGLGWYVRGNWIAMAGGSDGAMATVLHNRRWDFTVVILTNVLGNGMDEYVNPLLNAPGGVWGTSTLGKQFPCGDDLATTSGNECAIWGNGYIY